ncbi:Uma2 family endonuclease [Armatimonas rosea]|uniref:Uma2 family endonuclease n=1 Tax=Armatimonas rosea TaxID=685828 RepID=A0A7W9ST08_ARMRO|nr:Uma2 family endonuclease [Armatimonas rosea]MBB6052161.1 Uma2 family endonuclease [Armatimonas rosea]
MTPLTAPAPTPSPRRKRWNRDEYHRLAEQGWLGTLRWELIQGEIVEVMPQSPTHSTGIMRLVLALVPIFGLEFVRTQLPIVLGPLNEPEPDIVVTAGTVADYASQQPGAEDIRLLVEVSSTTLRDDLSVKAALYAQAGIPEYWVLDLENRRLYVHRNPNASGWGAIQNLGETEHIAPLAAPQASLSIAQLLS